MVVDGELLLVCDKFHSLAEFRRGFLHDRDVFFRLLVFSLAVDAADAGLGHPFAVDVGGFDLFGEGVPVG